MTSPRPKIFLGCDLSSAEDRIVKVRTGSEKQIERARRPPYEWDEHKYAAGIVYRIPMDTVTKDQRYASKKFKHGVNYGEQEQRISDSFLQEGFIVTTEECAAAKAALLEADPEILDYQRNIRRELMHSRKLRTAWGREIDYNYMRMDDDLYRKGYAWKPQSECNEVMVQWGLKPVSSLFKDAPEMGRVNQDGHDSLLMSVDPVRAWDVAAFLQASLEQPVEYDGVELVIPVEFSMGKNWNMQKEYKKLPKRKAFIEDAVALWEELYNQKYD
jgi:DNA polymerase I-like protein with 3'-5' exonuclease and polymerase domains